MRRGLSAALLVLLVASAGSEARAAQQTQNVWTTWTSSWKLSGAWGLSSDITLRSTDDWDALRSIEFRPGITYAVSPKLTLAGGVSVIHSYDPGPDTDEERLWMQAAVPQTLGRARVTHRLRVEERFIERIGKPDIEATRLRYLVRAQIPFATRADQPFRSGAYVSLQQELFVHVTGASDLNGHALDQWRLLAGIGRRFDPTTDLDITYLHQFVSGRTIDTRGHIVQVTLTTRF